MEIIRDTFTDHTGAAHHFRTEAEQVVMPDGKRLNTWLLPATTKTYTQTTTSNSAVVVDVSDFVLDDTDRYSYALELLSAISGEETSLAVVPVLHTATKTVVITRIGVTAGKVVDVMFRIIKRAL